MVVLADGSKSVEESFVLLLHKYRGSMNRLISILFHPRTRKCPRRKSSLSRKDRYLQWSTHVLQKSFIIMRSNEQTRTFPLKSTYYQNSSLSRGTNLICCHVVHTISPWPFRPESKCTFGTPLLQSRTMKRAQQIKRRWWVVFYDLYQWWTQKHTWLGPNPNLMDFHPHTLIIDFPWSEDSHSLHRR